MDPNHVPKDVDKNWSSYKHARPQRVTCRCVLFFFGFWRKHETPSCGDVWTEEGLGEVHVNSCYCEFVCNFYVPRLLWQIWAGYHEIHENTMFRMGCWCFSRTYSSKYRKFSLCFPCARTWIFGGYSKERVIVKGRPGGKKLLSLHPLKEVHRIFQFLIKIYGSWLPMDFIDLMFMLVFPPSCWNTPPWKPAKVHLKAGDLFYLPIFWWHAVQGSIGRNMILNWWCQQHPYKERMFLLGVEKLHEHMHKTYQRSTWISLEIYWIIIDLTDDFLIFQPYCFETFELIIFCYSKSFLKSLKSNLTTKMLRTLVNIHIVSRIYFQGGKDPCANKESEREECVYLTYLFFTIECILHIYIYMS